MVKCNTEIERLSATESGDDFGGKTLIKVNDVIGKTLVQGRQCLWKDACPRLTTLSLLHFLGLAVGFLFFFKGVRPNERPTI